MTQLKEAGTNPQEIDYEAMVSIRGIFIGTTNGSGKVTHTFEEEGFYLLVALKQG